MGVGRLHHVGVAVRSIDEALRFFSDLLGLEVESTIVVEEQGMRAAWLKLGDVKIELMEPLGSEGPVARFLAKRGEGVHHLALDVSDIKAISERLREAGIRLVYDEPRRAHDGSLYNFIHPKSAHGVLIELRQERSTGERGFEFLEHTADQYVLAYGPDLKSAFEEAARALFATMTDLSTVEPKVQVEIEVEGGDVKALLYNWLEALLLKLDIDGLLLSEFEVLELSGREPALKLRALAKGEPFDPSKHPQYVGVKGVTYHLMDVRELPGRVELRFLLDV